MIPLNDVRDFWNENPLCSRIIPYELGSRDYFNYYDRLREDIESKKESLRLHEYDKFNGKKILDVGCGTGYFLAKCLEKGWSVKGVENNINARNVLPAIIFKDIVDGLKPLIYQSEKFDLITMWHSLEHLHDLKVVIQDMKKLLTQMLV